MKTVGIIGGSGYTGGELIRLVAHHPKLALSFVYSTTRAGKALTSAHPDLLGTVDMTFTNTVDPNVDFIVLCLGHGRSIEFLSQHHFSETTTIVDLGNDFRLKADRQWNGKEFIYGLPEFQRKTIQTAKAIANPGCFATAIQLALLPLAQNDLLQKEVHVNATTGSTGAGVGLSATSHFSWRNNNLSWYKPFTHQHLGEIGETLTSFGSPAKITFLPQRGAFTRGIFATAYLPFEGTLAMVQSLYSAYYADHPFTKVAAEPLSLKQVVNSNFCFLHLHQHENKLLITSIIDNLIKGAAGQAIQNVNLMMGWEEDLGLRLKASTF
jgi:N-acetyl-gamma-glutamyl-phosphate reductase